MVAWSRERRGLLVQLVAAPVALAVDGVSYLLFALLLGAIRAREPAPAVAAAERLDTAIRSGITLVIRQPALRAVMATGSLLMLAETAWTSIQPVFLIRELGLAPAEPAPGPVTPVMLGRMNATMRFAMWGSMPLGGLAGGALGQVLGVRTALWICGACSVAATLPVLARSWQTS